VIGRVGDIRFDPKNFQAVVILNIDSRYQFPRDTSAKILTSGLLGEQYVGFEAGGDESNWVDGSVVQSTQSAVVLESLISQFLYNKAADTSATEK
jgi:phospholipid/cholesterol/gamma-HCH transport system substrate-binding protein